ncbi:glycosyltransferase family 39 protein [Sphaerothrix gracilis]|uniref:glycosyltransferase family 39 protein n=1 Tax=Sphaerothrix gracilis TaxID=3151835 RepID=UPI0031FC961C
MFVENIQNKLRVVPSTRFWVTPLTNYLQIFIAASVVLGIFFRFANLDLKPFWVDEVINTHYTFGYTEVDIGNQVQDWQGQAISIEELHRFQSPSPNKTPVDTIRALALEEPQSPPLYYLLLRGWIQIFGDSVAIRRSLSVFFSLLTFPCIYWLSKELFNSNLVAWLSVTLFSVSPIHIIYAQEARYYAAWTAIVALSSAVFLWSVRCKHSLAWVLYAATLTVGLYIYPFTGLIAISHGIYLAFINKFKLNQETVNYLLSLFASVVAFAPWGWLIAINSGQMSDWRQQKIPLLMLVKAWLSSLSITLWDFYGDGLWSISNKEFLLIFFLLVLFGYAFYCLIRGTSRKSWLFILVLILVPWLFLALPDLIKGGIRSTIPRYLMSCYLGIQLATAYTFGTKISLNPTSFLQRRIWKFILYITLSISLFSCLTYSQAKVWWNKSNNVDNPKISKLINKSESALVIARLTSNDGRSILSLSYSLEPNVQLQLLHDEFNAPKIPDGFADIFLYSLPDTLKEDIKAENNAEIEVVYQGNTRVLEKLKQ